MTVPKGPPLSSRRVVAAAALLAAAATLAGCGSGSSSVGASAPARPAVAAPAAGGSTAVATGGSVSVGGVAAAARCTLAARSCPDAKGDDVTARQLPKGFALKADLAQPGPTEVGGKGRMKVFEVPDKPWIGPGGAVGPRIIVHVEAHDPATLGQAVEQAARGRDVTERPLGQNTAVAGEHTSNLLAADTKQPKPVGVSIVHAQANPRVLVTVVGEGVALNDLLAFAATLEVS